jgi:N-acetylglucosamine-6-phosphate deacetylase
LIPIHIRLFQQKIVHQDFRHDPKSCSQRGNSGFGREAISRRRRQTPEKENSMMNVSGKHYLTGEQVVISIAEGRITCIKGEGIQEQATPETVWVAPGFCDLQINGYGGCDFNIGAWGGANEVINDLDLLFALATRSGAALICPTITTNSATAICQALSRLAHKLDSDRRLALAVPGIHLEGPFIASEDGPRGAHPLEHVRDPDWDEFCRFQEAAGGRIRICTLAPERSGALEFIERLAASGVTVALGHTGAEPDVIRAAVRAGARLSTHLGNGAHSRIARHPNYIWEQLAHDELYATVIPDGHHLPASVLKCFARCKGAEHLALVSDAVSLGGLPPGLYAEGRYEVLPTGKVVLAGTPYLAGAGHLLDVCVPHMLRSTPLTLAEVVGCVSTVPARILGLEGRKGHLRPGYDADLTLFRLPQSGPLSIVETISGGESLYRQH